MKMSANNAKQADILASAMVLPNSLGTAPGQWIAGKYDGQERLLMLLPGPPYELKACLKRNAFRDCGRESRSSTLLLARSKWR